MQKEEIFENIKQILREVIGKEDITLNTTPNDVAKWDSLNHAIIIDKLQKHFSITFDLFEIMELQSIEDFVNAISEKLNQ